MLIYLQMIETPEDQSKFVIIYEEYRDYMYRVAFAILHNQEDAEDAVHYAFMKIAEKYVSLLMSTTSTNVLNAPNAMTDIFASIAEINEYLQIVGLDDASRFALIQQKADLERVPNALAAINEAAGRMIYNSSNNTINVQNRNALTLYEKQAILACFTADISFNMFAAEVEYHADFLFSSASDMDYFYERAVRADMAIGEEYESGIADQYYNPNSSLVQAQINEHGEC